MRRRRFNLALLGTCLAAVASLFGAGPASALDYVPHTLESSFEGGFEGSITNVAADQASGSVYVVTYQTGIELYKFDAQGVPSAFSDPSLGGATSINLGATNTFQENPKLRVDNSGGPHQGRIYVSANFIDEHVWAFEPSGAAAPGYPLDFGSEDLAVSPVTGNFFLTGVPLQQRAYEYTPEAVKTGKVIDMSQNGFNYRLEAGPNEELITYASEHGLMKYGPEGEVIETLPAGFSAVFGIDPVSGYVLSARYENGVIYDDQGNELPGLSYEDEPKAVALNGVNDHIYVAFSNKVSIFAPQPPVTLPDVQRDPPSGIGPTSLTLNATVNPQNVTTTECLFEYGTAVEFGSVVYDETVPCEQGQAIGGNSATAVSASISGLSQGATYHYRVTVANANGTFRTKDATVAPSDLPAVANPYVSDVHSDSVVFHAEITPEGAPTTFHVLYGTGDCETEPATCDETAETASVGSALIALPVSASASGLAAGTTYHYVVVASNQSGTSESAQATFTTFPFTPVLEDKCDNAHVRQQTGAALLADCRAYELVSAAVARYDVESYLTPEQEPYGGYPYAQSPPRVLYGVHDGAIPGSGRPTNHGLDPYTATRGTDGWKTTYVGVPSNMPYSTESFASPLAGADATLDTFAFGGPGLCSPCFADGTTGVPVALPDGSLVQGMQGSEDPGTSAMADMLVKKPLSADGDHLIFGSTSEFESEAGSPAIYVRDLATGVTDAISKLPGGGSIPCLINCDSDGLAELDVSADGSRIVIGQLISTDSAGNRYWHLYMHTGDPTKTVDLTPGATAGALYGGMTNDGSTAYFTTVDAIDGEDSDESADLYEAQVGPTGASLHLVSQGAGGAGNSDGCDPLPNSVNEHWNTPGTTADCGVVAVGGGGGVAAADGSAYFLSPELLDGSSEPEDGSADQPNLYLYRPGSSPRFVATLESSATGPAELLEEHKFKKFFSASPNPEFVAVDNSGGSSDGDVYVADGNERVIRKYDSEGNPITSWQDNGEFEPNLGEDFAGIAVGPDGGLWVAIHKELNSCCDIYKFDEDGTLLQEGDLDGAAQKIGIAIDDQNRIFYESYAERIQSWKNGATKIVSTWEYESPPKTGVAVDPTSGTLYVGWGGVEVARFSFDSSERVILPNGSPCNSDCDPTATFGSGEVSNSGGMFVDPTRHELYVDLGNRILRYHGNGRRAAGPDVGAKVLSNSTSVAVSTAGDLYATNAGSDGANVAAFGPLVLAPDARTDNPLIIDSVNDSGSRHTGDLQITPDGDYGAFTTTTPLTGYANAGHEEVFRYDATGDAIECASCNPTNAQASGDSALAHNGLSLTDDGRIFFNSTDPLVPSDLDGREDVYEWSSGKTSLISTGLSPFNSSLLSASADGTDAYFFTRDTLVPEDLNGSLVKVYDAREHGGFPYTPPPVSCKASDECHGASTPAPAPPGISTITGSAGNHTPGKGKCRKGKVRRKGRCVKRNKGNHRKNRHGKKQSGGKRSGDRSRGGQG